MFYVEKKKKKKSLATTCLQHLRITGTPLMKSGCASADCYAAPVAAFSFIFWGFS